jgi:membrane associated rhomboid family serine protease
MIPYAATDTNDAEAIVPWTNLGLIALNFLGFFYELAVSATGGDNAASASGVAYWAHVGGFLTGVLLIRPFTVPARARQLQAHHAQHAQL